MIRTAKVAYGGADAGPKEKRTQWLGQTIMRRHSFLTAVKQIAQHQRLNDVTRISLQGVEGSGKTTMSKLIAHQLHVELTRMAAERDLPADVRRALVVPYTVHFFGDAEMVDFQATLEALPKNNRIIWFDDVSFLRGLGITKQQLDAIKRSMTIIRHLEGGTDVKTVLGLNFHYSKALDVYMRDTHFRFWTSLQPEELKNAKDLLSSARHRAVATKFQRYYALGSQGRPIKITDTDRTTSGKTTVVYRYNDPFRLALFSDNNGLRMCVYPSADKLVGRCGVCRPEECLADPRKTYEFMMKYCGKTNFLTGLKMLAMQRWGIPVYTKGIRQSLTMLDRLQKNGAIDEKWLISALRSFGRTKRMQARPYPNDWPIPDEVRKEFLDTVGTDGLKASNASERTRDTAYDEARKAKDV